MASVALELFPDRGAREVLEPAMSHPNVRKRWTLTELERGEPRELDRFDHTLVCLSEVLHALGSLEDPGGRDGSGTDPGEGSDPYAHHRPIVAKMLTQGIVASRRGRPPSHPLELAMHAEVLQPEEGEPYLEVDHKGEPLPYCRRSGMRQVWQCGQGHTGHRWVRCARADCATCQEYTSERRGKRLARRFGGVSCAHIVLTLPPVLVDLVGVEQIPALRRAAADTLRAWYELTTECDVGVIVGTHPGGDETPGWRPHFDCVVPLLGLSRWSPEHPQNVELPYFRSERDLDLLRALWLGVCLRALRFAGVPPEQALHAPNVWYGFALDHSPDQVEHHYRYAARPFPTWAAGGSWPATLSRARAYGLCSRPTSRKGVEVPELVAWRAAVRRPEEGRDHAACFIEGCDCHLELVEVTNAWAAKRFYPWAVNLDELDLERATGPPREGVA